MKAGNLFSNGYAPRSVDLVTLMLRISFGSLMAPHGYAKLMSYAEKKSTFMTFMGLGPATSLALVIFAELFCSLLLAVGLLTRLALIPLMILALVIVFKANGGDIAGEAFDGFAYLMIYVTVFLLGPGRYSLDAFISRKLRR